MKITDTLWFSPWDICTLPTIMIGVVLGVDEITGEKKAYIGAVIPTTEELDSKMIVENGAPFTGYDAIKALKHFKE